MYDDDAKDCTRCWSARSITHGICQVCLTEDRDARVLHLDLPTESPSARRPLVPRAYAG